MPDSETTIDSALDNLAQIKTGGDPRGPRGAARLVGRGSGCDRGPEDGDPLLVAREEVDRLFEECEMPEHLYRTDVHVAVARWKRKNGTCWFDRRLSRDRYGQRVTRRPMENITGQYSVAINERIHEQGRVDEFIDTVRHEVSHVVAYVDPACGPHGSSPGHDDRWKRWARRLGADPSSCHRKKENTYTYWYGCPNGCWKSGRHRRSKKVRLPGRYHCSRCKADCVSWRDGEDRPTEPGVSV